MTGERGPSVPLTSTRLFRRGRVTEAFRANRAGLVVVVVLVALSIGHVLLPGAGAQAADKTRRHHGQTQPSGA
jgi:hypothetical protein